MKPAPFIPPLAGDAARMVRHQVAWAGNGRPPERIDASGQGVGVGAFCLVALGHLGLAALALTQVLTVSAPEQASAGDHGPLRVRLVSNKPEPAVLQPVVQPPPPPPPKPEKKTLATEAPGKRVVEAPPPKPEPVPHVLPVAESVAPPQPVAPPPAAAAAAVAAPGPAAPAAGKPDALDLGAAPKEVGQISCSVPKPEYPRSSRRRGEAGTVSIRLVMDARGQVTKAEVEHSSGFPDLDASARRAALAAQCQPYRENGRAINVSALQPFQFVPSD